jgi:hypothetical protein
MQRKMTTQNSMAKAIHLVRGIAHVWRAVVYLLKPAGKQEGSI